MECLVFRAYFSVCCLQKFPTPVKKRIFEFLYCMSLLEVRKCLNYVPQKLWHQNYALSVPVSQYCEHFHISVVFADYET